MFFFNFILLFKKCTIWEVLDWLQYPLYIVFILKYFWKCASSYELLPISYLPSPRSTCNAIMYISLWVYLDISSLDFKNIIYYLPFLVLNWQHSFRHKLINCSPTTRIYMSQSWLLICPFSYFLSLFCSLNWDSFTSLL